MSDDRPGEVDDATFRKKLKDSHPYVLLAARWLEDRGFKVGKVLVKSQRTRWASCSGRGNVSLNLKLLFVPAPLVRYVFIHELCHLVHPNHSRDFWGLVASHEPDYRKPDRELRQAWRYVPAWLDAERMLPSV